VVGTKLARKVVKAAVLPAGLATARTRGDFVILLYHRVGVGRREIDLPREVFQRQLESLLEHDRLLALDEALKDDAPGGVVLTFDDGYPDFHDHVLPLLQRYRIPATLYLVTSLVGAPGDHLTWSQIREATETGLVTVGTHTHEHVDLSRATDAVVDLQLRRSKQVIEEQLDLPCSHFAYPWAVASPTADRLVRTLFRSSACDAWRTNRRGRIDPYRLGRTPVLRSDGRIFFRAKASGRLDAEAVAYRALRRGPWRYA
jgi:peptidoglycan/xylan/chitin deacetylase (PgdA/CDA1 family)